MYTLVGAAKRNDIDPQAWLADVLGRTAETPQSQLDRLLPWSWVPKQTLDRAAQACSARRSITSITPPPNSARNTLRSLRRMVALIWCFWLITC